MPYTYQFTGSATNNPTSWFWEFGDGTTSRLQSPKQYYSQPGTYTVRLTATNSVGQNAVSQSVNVVSSIPTPTPTPTPAPSNGPQANFVASATEGATPLSIQFVDTSTGSPTAWHWIFGDGSVGSTQQNPVYLYTEAIPNTKTVRLTAENSYGSSYKEITISTYYPFPVAVQYAPSTTSGYAPLTVQFNGDSNGAPGVYSWNFGDGSMAYELSPTHTYTTAGTYTALFTITDSYGTSTASQIITVNAAPATASFMTDVTSGIAPLTVQFTDTSAASPTSWSWNFGDGTVFNTTDPGLSSPAHTFTTTGTFTVSLTASNSIGGSTATQQIIVTDTPPPTNTDPVEWTVPGTYTYTVPAGITSLNVVAVGAGGGGGGGCYGSGYGSGGSGGEAGSVISQTMAVSPGNTISVIVGTKGARGSSQVNVGENGIAGGPGGQSQVGSLPAATGGFGGAGGVWTYGILSPNGGNGENGFGTGQYAEAGASVAGTGGAGGIGRGAGGGGASYGVGGYYGGYGANGYVNITPVLPSAPVAEFSTNSTEGIAPLAVMFTDQSTNTPYSWSWNFGDGSTSTAKNPVHVYSSPGIFTVSLTVRNAAGTDTRTKTSLISVTNPVVAPAASFTASPTSGNRPLTVQFTDTSTGDPTSWMWDFGDGNTTGNSQQNPVHLYTTAGTYAVKLTAGNSAGDNTITRTNLITVTNPVIAPVANFTANRTSGTVPLMIRFTDRSTNTPTSWFWDFGDGTNSTAQSPPVHGYPAAGNYSVSLTVTNDGGSDTMVRAGYITGIAPVAPPVASFTATPTSGIAPLTVQFTDTSSGTVDSRVWDFDNDQTSTEQNPVITYPTPGVYTVSLAVTGPGGSNTTTRTDYITVTEAKPLVADFDAMYLHIDAGVRDQFFDATSGYHDAWSWDFGDGGTSAVKNPVHTYNRSGIYTVSLTVWNGTRTDSTTRTDYIHVHPVASFTADVTTGEPPLTVTFTDTSAGYPGNWSWNFGDGGTSTEQNPVHTYTAPGTYTVSLTVTGAYGDTETRTDYITVTRPTPLVADFDAMYLHIDTGVRDQFFDATYGYHDAWSWDFGDGGTSAVKNPVHTYNRSGIYTVSLTVWNGTRTDSITRTDYIHVHPVASFTADVTTGEPPLTVTFTDTSAGYPGNWSWDFGDGGTSTEQNPVHTYTAPGTYTVSLTVTGAYGDTETRMDYIVVSAPPTTIPVADFVGILTSGPAPLEVQFSDLSTNSPTTYAWFFGDEEYDEPWQLINDSPGWLGRTNHASVVMPDGSLLLMGGWDYDLDDYYSDIWRSTDNGADWTLVNSDPGWDRRMGHTCNVMPDGSIVLIGGRSGYYGGKNDVWRSTDGGVTWTQQTASAPWSKRWAHTSVVMPDGSIILMGGVTPRVGANSDVWRSTDYGVTWTQQTASAPWSKRWAHTSVVTHDGASILVMAGKVGTSSKNDVWSSTDYGATWTQLTASAGWSPRTDGPPAVVMPDGSILMMNSGGIADMWRSTDGGVTWNSAPTGTIYKQGLYATANIMTDGSVVRLGGRGYIDQTSLDHVYRFQPVGSSEENPTHIYIEPGTYTVSLYVANALGSDTKIAADYITINNGIASAV